MVHWLEVQYKSKMFPGSDNISVLGFPAGSRSRTTPTKTHGGAANRLFYFFMRKPAGANCNERTCLFSSSSARQEGKLTSYSGVLKCLLGTSANNKIMLETNMEIMQLWQRESQKAMSYRQAFWMKSLPCRPFDEGYRHKRTFIQETRQSIW